MTKNGTDGQHQSLDGTIAGRNIVVGRKQETMMKNCSDCNQPSDQRWLMMIMMMMKLPEHT